MQHAAIDVYSHTLSFSTVHLQGAMLSMNQCDLSTLVGKKQWSTGKTLSFAYSKIAVVDGHAFEADGDNEEPLEQREIECKQTGYRNQCIQEAARRWRTHARMSELELPIYTVVSVRKQALE